MHSSPLRHLLDHGAWILPLTLCCMLLTVPHDCTAEPIRVRYIEGVTLGFLVLEDQSGKALAYGELNQVVSGKDGVVTDDLRFQFKDGSSYRETTKFTQRDDFRLVSDHVVQKGPAFKQDSDVTIEAATGTVTIKTLKDGKEHVESKHLDLPPDVSNGLLFTLVNENLDPDCQRNNRDHGVRLQPAQGW